MGLLSREAEAADEEAAAAGAREATGEEPEDRSQSLDDSLLR